MRLSIDGISYHVDVQGSGEAVMLLHGFTGNGGTWKETINILSGSFRTIAVDLPGHGQTDAPADLAKYEMEAVAAHLLELLNRLKIDHVHLLGYSMGGRLALGMSILYPERFKSLMLESSSPGLRTKVEREQRIMADQQLAEKILKDGIESFVDYWENIPLFSTQKALPVEKQRAIRQSRLKNRAKGLANSLLGMGTGRQPSWWDRLQELQVPVLVICGELDVKFCRIAKEMDKRIPDSRLVILEGAGHALHVEEPMKFGTIVKEFLMEIV
ncbi:2-succinyl-6-hydroxy-2,4-cyclohexadiene-1-carboxylate synthase [Siminovitchia sp. 179-K 8D1 HS]|uniref:2-succinyl-6-hydroxy-2, 4-cyclohexadiene-1-carboxylate synthase n=1 Tax=Siminovitchia sp. 179-K 8D1 HS TaxID=3142385 RepID=UPI00399F6DFC